MTYVENGAEFTHEYGDIDERFYSSVESALNELAALLLREAPGMYPQFIERWREWNSWPATSAGDLAITLQMSSRSWRTNSAISDYKHSPAGIKAFQLHSLYDIAREMPTEHGRLQAES